MRAEPNGFSMRVSVADNKLARVSTRAVGVRTCTGLQFPGGFRATRNERPLMPTLDNTGCNSLDGWQVTPQAALTGVAESQRFAAWRKQKILADKQIEQRRDRI